MLDSPYGFDQLKLHFILGHGINNYINEWMFLHLVDLSSYWTESCFQGF